MTIEAYRFNAKKEDDSRRAAKQGMEFCKLFIENKLPFGTFRTIVNEKIFPENGNAPNPGVMKFNTADENIINNINAVLSSVKIINKKIFKDCYYVLIDCGSLPII